MTERDTREKLEADILVHYKTPEEKLKTVREWLDRQSAITQRECNSAAWKANYEHMKRRADGLTIERDELARAYKERGRIIEELREQLRNDDEPFCETVKRWLTDDAPEECIECEYGCWRRMHELMAEECDSCGPMHAAEREIRELKTELADWEKLTEGIELPSYPMAQFKPKDKDRRIKELEDERDHMQRVIQAQAESFKKLEAASAMPADCTDCRHLDELRALRRRIRKLARFAGLLD